MATTPANAEIETNAKQIGRELLDRLRAARPRIWQRTWWQEFGLRQLMKDEWLKVQAFRFVDALPMMHDDEDIARHLREYFVPAAEEKANHGGTEARRNRSVGPPSPTANVGWVERSETHHPDARTSPATGTAAVAAEQKARAERSRLARLAGWWMNWSRDAGFCGRTTAAFARKTANAMSGSFIAGSNIDEAEAAIRKMRRTPLAFTIDLLGEAALSTKEAAEYHEKYVHLIEELPKRAAQWTTIPQIDVPADGVPLPVVNVSVKITSIFPGFDPIAPDAALKRAKELMRPILRAGMAGGAHIHVDMEHYAIKDLTLQLVKELFAEDEFRDYPHFGVVLQAYLVDGDRDTEDMIAYAKRRGTPLWIRLVKGAYWDTETVIAEREHWPCPVWMQKWQSDACYERCARRLIENHQHIRTAFASHNIRSLAFAMALRDAHGAPPSAFELQMLFGMGDPIKQALAERGERCRVYTPYGDVLPGMAYLIRRLLENTANESFLRQGSDDDVSPDELLQDPETEYDPTNPPPEPDWPCVALDEIQHCAPPRYFVSGVQREPFVNIADTNFESAESREKMREALNEVRKIGSSASHPICLFGKRDFKRGELFESHNPSFPTEVVGIFDQASASIVDVAVGEARQRAKEWSATPARMRSELLFSLAKRVEQSRYRLAARLSLEVGKPWREADGEVSEAIDYLNYYAKAVAENAQFHSEFDVPGETNEHFYQSRGVVVAITPWNFSLALLVSSVAAALATGNVVIAKPSKRATITAHWFLGLATSGEQVQIPMMCLPGDGATIGDALVRHPGVDMVVFTGSRETGLAVNRAAAESAGPRGPKKVLLELGAKNAIIVDDDADLDEAVKGVLASAFGYAGQKCSAASRVIVVDKAHDRFMERFVEAAKSLRLGPAEEPTTSVPPVISKEAYESIRAWIETGKREANCVLEVQPSGELKQSGGYYIGPVIFDDVAPDAQIAQQEIFGPVVAVIRAGTFEEAVDIFNGTDYALTGGVYSRSPHNLDYARANCTCGNLYINRPIVGSHVGRQPFGGLRGSGDGARVGGVDYLKEFCVARTVSENTLRRGFAPSEEVAESIG